MPRIVMQSYQVRVLEERRELEIKLGKLDAFIRSEAFAKVGEPERTSLILQATAMNTYALALGQRIAAWGIDIDTSGE